MESKLVDNVLVEEIRIEVERSLVIFVCLRISHPRSGNHCVCDGGVHRHSVSHAHFSDTFSLRGVQTSSASMAQGVCSAHVISLHLTFSLLMLHPPSLLFPDGHFDPGCTFLAELFPIRKRGSSALPHERRGVWLPGRSDALHRMCHDWQSSPSQSLGHMQGQDAHRTGEE